MKEDICEVSKEALKLVLYSLKRKYNGYGDNYMDLELHNAYTKLLKQVEENDQD